MNCNADFAEYLSIYGIAGKRVYLRLWSTPGRQDAKLLCTNIASGYDRSRELQESVERAVARSSWESCGPPPLAFVGNYTTNPRPLAPPSQVDSLTSGMSAIHLAQYAPVPYDQTVPSYSSQYPGAGAYTAYSTATQPRMVQAGKTPVNVSRGAVKTEVRTVFIQKLDYDVRDSEVVQWLKSPGGLDSWSPVNSTTNKRNSGKYFATYQSAAHAEYALQCLGRAPPGDMTPNIRLLVDGEVVAEDFFQSNNSKSKVARGSKASSSSSGSKRRGGGSDRTQTLRASEISRASSPVIANGTRGKSGSKDKRGEER